MRHGADKTHAPGKRRHQRLDFPARRSVADQQRPPRPVPQPRESLGEHAVGLELVARAHHADAQQQGRPIGFLLGGGARGGAERRDIDEGRQPELVRAGPEPRPYPGDVAGIDRQHEVRRRERTLDGAMAEPRRSLGPARRMRGLGDHVGNVERPRHDRPQPVGLAVVAVIGEPEIETLGMAGRQRPPAVDQSRGLGAGAAFERQMSAGCRHARGDAAQGRHHDAMAQPAQQAGQPARHLAIARGRGTVRWLQRRVQQHAHGDHSAARDFGRRCWPSAPAIQSIPASKEKRVRTISAARCGQPGPEVGIADQSRQRRRQLAGRPGRHQQAVHAVLDELANGGGTGRDDGEALVGRLHQHVGQAVLVAVGRLLGWPARRGRRARRRRTPPSAAGRRARCSDRRCRAWRPLPSARRKARRRRHVRSASAGRAATWPAPAGDRS